ncbi:hypothetical protein SAMN05720470_107139 [Fibrobacter sp. UWOV1]|uniref:hypothetical protein n=1 Tax=Fibrobacter sp. UWOV1 TaxID=1896215 RepID=UPI00091A9952|nr:hypothetical protein [Fibrobacter sp. UWOV1]SHL37669.1 hypothetical protein SAMN05720470_107139 [Fibrobacter sp. UWOV1]
MEGLLILIGIWVLDIVIKKVAANRREQQQREQQVPPQYPNDDDELDESEEQAQGYHPPRSLQDLIRQFENAQREATQGNIEPPTPPVQRKHPEQLTLRDIAEVVIEVDEVNLEFLMEEFDVDENTAAEMLMDLQAHRIVGHDMGEGDCDVLVHDLEELDNLLSHEKIAEQERKESLKKADDRETDEEDSARQRELDRQRELNALEDRARSARESAAAFMGNDVVSGTEQAPRRAPLVSTKNLTDVRKGFIWAKVLDEPRFKRRWSAQYR